MVEAHLPISDIALRLGLAFVSGAVIGLERENHGRAAGLRTTVLVCISAAVAMILSESLFMASDIPGSNWRPDPTRLGAGILTGMGFLGAGAILREGRIVRGVTTAAALWCVTIIGLAYGAGHVFLGFCGFGLALLTLFVLPRFEHVIRNDWYGSISVTVDMNGISDSDLRSKIEAMGVGIKSVELDYNILEQRRTVSCRIKYKNGKVFDLSERVVRSLMECQGVTQVRWS